MIVRLVRMEFKPENLADFLELFAAVKNKISSFKGCLFLELKKEIGNDNAFFTLSHWDSEQSLNAYRNSELFSSVWTKTKIHFSGKPMAWTLTDSL